MRVRQTHIGLIVFGIFIGFSFNFFFEMHTYRTMINSMAKSRDSPIIEKSKSFDRYERLHSTDNNFIANQLHKDVKVLCWIMTCPTTHKEKAIHVKKTWGRRCNKLLFMSTAKDDNIDAIELPVSEGRDNLWAKTREAFKYIYKNHLNDYDWFLKADDDTYVVVENLRYLLYPYATDIPIYFGCKFKPHVKQGYMAGGPGYVLSREAVRRFVEVAIPNKDLCRVEKAQLEDIELGKCLENVNVTAGDSRDSDGRGRFFPFMPRLHLNPELIGRDCWYWNYTFFEDSGGLNSCSNYAISFHYIEPYQFYELEYLIYQLRPFGIDHIYNTYRKNSTFDDEKIVKIG